jgi:hypothetical protein
VWTGAPPEVTALLATGHDYLTDVKVDVTAPNGAFLYDFKPDSGSSTTEDETATTRRVTTITLSTTAIDGLVPGAAGDLLHPLTGNEIRPYNGIVVSPGAPVYWIPMGVYTMSAPAVTEPAGGGVTMTLALSDRSAVIARNKWTGPWTGAAGLTIDAAIMAGLKMKWPGTTRGYPLTFNFTPTTVRVPANTILGIQYTATGASAAQQGGASQNNPWADFQALALEAGMELLFDRIGVATLRPVPQPGDGPVVMVMEEGDLNRAIALGRRLDGDAFANSFTVIGSGARTPALGTVGSKFTLTNASGGNDITKTVTVPAGATQAVITCTGGQGCTAAGTPAGKGGTITVVIPDIFPGTVLTCTAGTPGITGLTGPGGGLAPPGWGGGGGASGGDASTVGIVGAPAGNLWAFGGAGGATIGADGAAYTQNALATVVSTGISQTKAGSVTITWQAASLVQGPLVRATAEDNNPSSPGFVGGPLGVIPADVIVSTTIATTADAATAAKAALAKGEALADETNATASANPLIDVGDACSINRSAMQIAATYIMSAITTPLGLTDSLQAITNRAASIEVFTGKAYVTTYMQNLPPAYRYGRGGVVLPISEKIGITGTGEPAAGEESTQTSGVAAFAGEGVGLAGVATGTRPPIKSGTANKGIGGSGAGGSGAGGSGAGGSGSGDTTEGGTIGGSGSGE